MNWTFTRKVGHDCMTDHGLYQIRYKKGSYSLYYTHNRATQILAYKCNVGEAKRIAENHHKRVSQPQEQRS